MGSTITTGKLASAFMDAKNEVWYALYEETYEKNCHPHRPRWNCIYFGQLAGALKQIFRYASACEGGMLRARNGDIKPESYITAWLNELSNPVAHQPNDVTIQVGKSFNASVPEDMAELAASKLKGLGREDIAKALEDGNQHVLRMDGDAAIIAELYGEEPALGTWRVITYTPQHAARDALLGYSHNTT